MDKYELEERFIKFSISAINELRGHYHTVGLESLYNQMIRSASSAALNYSEAIGAETTKDFIHKLSVSVKEIRETYSNMRILKGVLKEMEAPVLEDLIEEGNQLIAILTSSIKSLKGKKKASSSQQSKIPVLNQNHQS